MSDPINQEKEIFGRTLELTRFCDEHRLSTRERLELFIQVCRAIQHAHHKGIIHRDIKPSNILVTVNDGVPVPKVIDFGIAKATTQQRLTDKTLFTAFAQFIGTPAYMSPEQAEMTSLDIDTRSDVYALGVLVYELLTGRTPFDTEQLLAAGLDEMRRTIREKEPLRPSTRLSRMAGVELTTAARQRHAEAPRLIHLLRGDLDWIVMKALEKDRSRRYETAHALAEDLERYLRHDPVLAAPPGLVYRSGKFWRRHRSRILTTAVVTALVMGLGATLWWYQRNVRGERIRWAQEAALPEILNLVQQEDYAAAYALAQQAKAIIPEDPALAELWPRICQDYSITTTPAGAEVFYRDYAAQDAPWTYLGRSPLERVTLPQLVYRWKIEKPGFVTHECVVNHSFEVQLQEEGPRGEMVWMSGWTVEVPGKSEGQTRTAQAPPYLIDRYEVTNEEFQKFVDAGGYKNPKFWQELEFVKEGRRLSFTEAVSEFHDQTDLPGPETWANGTYPAGRARHPVSGVSWFEAVAYATFAGKSLPTVHHWERAACLTEALVIIRFSNFGSDTAPVGSHSGMSHTGLYDMAGNVKEWCLNATRDSQERRNLLGGGWGEPTYVFAASDFRSPWDRSAQNGFRCVDFPTGKDAVPSELFQPRDLFPSRDVSELVSFSDDEFRVLKDQYDYDRTPLNATVESRGENSLFWREEKITFDAAYNGDRVIAYLFLPKAGQPPYQTVIYCPGGSAVYEEVFEGLPGGEPTENMITSGRAVLCPVYYGTYERPAARGRVWTFDSVAETPLAYRDWMIKMVKDLRRSIDYLETRDDIDSERIAFCGNCWGAMNGVIMLAVEDRIDTGILVLGGIPPVEVPRSIDMALYAERVRVPVLMVNGWEDAWIPYKTSQLPLLDRLRRSTTAEHKLYPGGHGQYAMFYRQIRGDILDWLDRY